MSEAEKAIQFIETLKYPQGTDFYGEPVRLLNWQKEFIRKLLATNEYGKRIIKRCRLWLGRGSGKTHLIAFLFVYLLFKQNNGSLVVVANTIKEASQLFEMVASTISQDKFLGDRKNSRTFRALGDKRIECYYSKSTFSVMANALKGALGKNVSILACDEVGFYESRELYEALETSMQKRTKTDTLLITISTCGSDVESFGYELYEETKRIIAEPEIDPSFLGLIYQGDLNKWEDIEEWKKANPSLNELANIDHCKKKIESAKRNPSEIPGIQRYFLNHWVVGDEMPWIDLLKWDAIKETAVIPPRSVVWVGVDIASVSDFSCVSVLAKVGDKYVAEMYYFTPKKTLQVREAKHKAPYTKWVQQKYLTLVDGDVLDSTCVKDCLLELRKKYQIREVAIDRYYNSNDLSIELQKQGFNVVPIGAGTRTIVPVAKEFEALVLQQKFLHNYNPILRWNVNNCRAYIADENGGLMISKKRSRGKIDGVFACFYALAREMEHRNAGPGSVSVVKF